MPFKNQQHLTPDNLAMLQRSLARVEKAFQFDKASPESKHVAAMMVAEFQRGTHTEDEMIAIFLGKKFPRAASPNQARLAEKKFYPRRNGFYPPHTLSTL